MTRRKFSIGDRVIGNDKKASFRGRKGTVAGYEPGSQYWVKFDDGPTECVYSWWLEKELEARSLPSEAATEVTLADLTRHLGELSVPEGFADDLEYIQSTQPKVGPSPWPTS